MPSCATTREVSVSPPSGGQGGRPARPLLLTPGQDLRGYLLGHIGRATLLAFTFVSVVAVLLMFVFIIGKARHFFLLGDLTESFSRLGQFLAGKGWYPTREPPEFGGLSLIIGSVYVTVVALLFAVPVGLMAAMFLSDIAPFTVRQFFKPIIELLAAIPSVAYGFFAVLVVAPWLQNTFGFTTGVNVYNAGLLLGVMAVPTIISVAEDALSAVGRERREASYGLGATRAETLIKVVLPAARSGIVAAVLLGMMRAVGETMVVLMAAGMAAQVPSPWWDLSQSVRPITATIAQEMGETSQDTPHFYALFALGLLLLLFTFLLNLISEYFLARAHREATR